MLAYFVARDCSSQGAGFPLPLLMVRVFRRRARFGPRALLLFAALFVAGCRAPEASSPPIDIVELSVEDISRDLAASRYTVVELAAAHLDRIARYEDAYNAFISLNPNVLEEAARLDAVPLDVRAERPLFGVPIVLKDNIDQAGQVTTAGFEGFSAEAGGVDLIAPDDAASAQRLRAAGALILGKTNLPDFAGHGTRTRSTVAGETLNPYAPDRVPGGSSGGSATAINASFAVLALGTETGGSIQNPAGAQALVGIKPTFGLVPLDGVVPIDGVYRDVVGPLARSVRDAALTLDVIAGPDPRDPASYASAGRIPEAGYGAELARGALRGVRLGLVGAGWREDFLPLAPETNERYLAAQEVLVELGAEVIPDPFANSGWWDLYRERPGTPTVRTYGLAGYLRSLGPEASFGSIDQWEALSGRKFPGREPRPPPTAPTATEEGDAYSAWRMKLRTLFREVFERHELDALFFPQAGAPIRPLVEDPERPEYRPNNHAELPSNIVNDLGVPTVTVPASYYEDGTPFVAAFIGRLWTEAALIGYAYDFEQRTLARRAPELSAR